MHVEQFRQRQQAAVPHSWDQPCTCTGCDDCGGAEVNCDCDVDYDALVALVRDLYVEGMTAG